MINTKKTSLLEDKWYEWGKTRMWENKEIPTDGKCI